MDTFHDIASGLLSWLGGVRDEVEDHIRCVGVRLSLCRERRQSGIRVLKKRHEAIRIWSAS